MAIAVTGSGMVECLRRVVRDAIGSRGLYAVAARLVDFCAVVRREGLGRWILLERLRRGADPTREEKVSFRSIRHPVLLRATRDDVVTAINTIVRSEWGQFTPATPPEWLVDAGAYIGDSTAYFLSRFESLRAVALEPAVDSFAIAARNLAPYGDRVALLRSALWYDDNGARLSGASTNATLSESGVAVETISIPTLMRRFRMSRIDILKLDIEGAEAALFAHSDAAEWLRHADLLILEIHGERAMQAVSSRLAELGFSMRRFRSVWYCSPQRAAAGHVVPTAETVS